MVLRIAILSTGEKIANPKYYREMEQVPVATTRTIPVASGSNNRNKARIKLAKHHEYIANCRRDFLQKLSTELINNNDIICIEGLTN